MVSRYKIIHNTKDLKLLIRACKATKYCCFDFETSGEPLYNEGFYPTILSVSFQAGSSIIIPLNHFESPNRDKRAGGNGKWKSILKKFGRSVIENPDITKVAWNWKFDNQIMSMFNIHHRGRAIDGMLAKYLLDEEKPSGLKEMVNRYLPGISGYEDYEGSKLPWDKKPLIGLSEYAGKDTDATLRLSLFFEKKLIDLGFYSLYRNLIMMASKVLQDTEKWGMKLDIPFNDELIIKYQGLIKETEKKLMLIRKVKKFQNYEVKRRKTDLIDRLQDEIKQLKREDGKDRQIRSREDKIKRISLGEYITKEEKAIDEPINLNSTKQMVDLLYLSPKGFKFPIIKYTKDKYKRDTTTPSTGEETILELRQYDKYNFINTLVELRKLSTINSTFVLGIRDKLAKDGRIHPIFNIHGTVTGRLSSKHPNFQNLPRKNTNPDIKKMMIPDKERGNLFLMLDYSQAELRVLAHMAKEKTMLEWFNTGKDIHLASACKKYNEDYDEILKIYNDPSHSDNVTWQKRRKQAKTINFGIVYEQTSVKLAESLSNPDTGDIVTPAEAQLFLDEFFELFPNIKRFIEKQHKLAKKQGWVKTLFGRKRRLPGIYSDNYREFLEAQRFSSNAPIQGTASDFALFSSVLIWEGVKKGELPELHECTTVHDSLIYEINCKDITADLVYKIWTICKNPNTKEFFGFQINDVEMGVDFGVGRTYAEELPYIPGYDYSNLYSSNFDLDDYYKLYKKTKNIDVSDYPKKFKK